MIKERLVPGDIVRNPWQQSAKQDFIFIKRGKKFCHMLSLEFGIDTDVIFYKNDVDENFTKIGHSHGFDQMFKDVEK